MPIALDPQQTFKVVLSSDKGKTSEPAFIFRYLTDRQWKRIARLDDAMHTAGDGATALGVIEDAIRVGLVGWSNMIGPDGQQIAYDPAKLDDLITPGEARELLGAMLENVQLQSSDLGKSQSQP